MCTISAVASQSKGSTSHGRTTHLLGGMTVGEDVLNHNIKFAKVVFSETVPVPANSLQQYILDVV